MEVFDIGILILWLSLIALTGWYMIYGCQAQKEEVCPLLLISLIGFQMTYYHLKGVRGDWNERQTKTEGLFR